MTALRRRLAAALDAGRATRKPDVAAKSEAPPLNTRRMIVALMQGQTLAQVKDALIGLRKTAAKNGYGIVIVTDQRDIALFQIPDCITEFLPAPAEMATAHDPYLYVQTRLGILLRKWEPVQVLPFGADAMTLHLTFQATASH